MSSLHPIATERLLDALGAARLIHTTVRDTTFEQYVADVWFRSATERQLMVIGEALNQARRSSPQLVDQFPKIGEWIALRNVLSHVYNRINHALIWRTATQEILELIEALQRILTEHGNKEE